MTSADVIAAVDVGNTAIKVALRRLSDVGTDHSVTGAENCFATFSLDQPGWGPRICDWVQKRSGSTAVSWWVSTVNRAASGPLYQAVSDVFGSSTSMQTPRGEPAWRVFGYQDVPIEIEVDFPDKVGIDRLLSAYAASTRFELPLVVVDVGSAVTIDLVRSDASGRPVFAGGAILPGIRLQHAALASGTEGLQRLNDALESGRQAPFRRVDATAQAGMRPGTNTEQAIRLGVIAAVTGAVERLAREYARVGPAETGSDEPISIVLTGGDASIISDSLTVKHKLTPNLVCEGIMVLAIQQCQIAAGELE